MNIKGIVEKPEGNYEVIVEVNSAQHKFIFETGLRFLVATGAMPMIVEGSKEAGIINNDDGSEPTLN